MADTTITLTATANDNITPQFTFSGTCICEIDGVAATGTNVGTGGALTSGSEATIGVTTNQEITYTFSDWDSITYFNISGDPVSGDVSGWVLPSTLKYFYIYSTSCGGDVSGWVLPSTLKYFIIYSTSCTYGTSGAFTGLTASLTGRVDFDDCNLTEAMVDRALADCKTSGVDNLVFEIAGNNTAPSDTGMQDAYELSYLAGWTVIVTTPGGTVAVGTQEEIEGIGTDSNTLGWKYKQTADVIVSGEWNVIGSYLAPLTGDYDGDGNKITDISITGSNDYVGMFGRIIGSVTKLGVEGNVSGNNYVGLLAGKIDGSIDQSYSKGSVEGSGSVGGIAGEIGYATKSYSHASVSGSESVGGFAGASAYGTISSNCYSIGKVVGAINIGGFCGTNSGTLSDCYYDSDTSGQNDTGKGTPKTTAEMQSISTFDGWDFDDTWYLSGYPALRAFRPFTGIFNQGYGGQGFGFFIQR